MKRLYILAVYSFILQIANAQNILPFKQNFLNLALRGFLLVAGNLLNLLPLVPKVPVCDATKYPYHTDARLIKIINHLF